MQSVRKSCQQYQHVRLTVSPLLPPVASRNLLLYQSLPTRMPDREAKVRRRKDDTGVGTATQRQAAILRDCLVSPDVFSPMVGRLGTFVVPYQQALEAKALSLIAAWFLIGETHRGSAGDAGLDPAASALWAQHAPAGGLLHARRGLHLSPSAAAINAQRVGAILPSSRP
jgi:hypothetical protein